MRYAQVKTLEDFNVAHLITLGKEVLGHLATSTYIGKVDNVVLLGPPRVGKTHLAIDRGYKAIAAGHALQLDKAIWLPRHAPGRAR